MCLLTQIAKISRFKVSALHYMHLNSSFRLGFVAQSVTCLPTDLCLAADPRVASFDPNLVPYFRGDWSWNTGPRSAVSNVSGNRCESGCRSRGSEFDPNLVPYFHRDWSWNNFYSHSHSFRWFKKGCCQLQEKVCARINGYPLSQACPGRSVVSWTDHPDMTIAVDWDVKNQTNQIS